MNDLVKAFYNIIGDFDPGVIKGVNYHHGVDGKMRCEVTVADWKGKLMTWESVDDGVSAGLWRKVDNVHFNHHNTPFYPEKQDDGRVITATVGGYEYHLGFLDAGAVIDIYGPDGEWVGSPYAGTWEQMKEDREGVRAKTPLSAFDELCEYWEHDKIKKIRFLAGRGRLECQVTVVSADGDLESWELANPHTDTSPYEWLKVGDVPDGVWGSGGILERERSSGGAQSMTSGAVHQFGEPFVSCDIKGLLHATGATPTEETKKV